MERYKPLFEKDKIDWTKVKTPWEKDDKKKKKKPKDKTKGLGNDKIDWNKVKHPWE